MSLQLGNFRRYMERRPLLLSPQPAREPVLVVGSGKGGVGTSTLASLLAVVASERGSRVLLVDADASVGSLHLLFGVGAGAGLGALRDGETTVADLLVSLSDRLTLLPGGGEPGELGPAERQALFRRVASLYVDYDLVVVDGGSRLESVRSACASAAGRVIAVTTADRVSVAATYALIKALGERFPATPVDLLVNREDAPTSEVVAAEIREASRHFLHQQVGLAGFVPDDLCLPAGVVAGMSLADAAAGSPAALAVQAVASHALHQLTAAIPAFVERHHYRRS